MMEKPTSLVPVQTSPSCTGLLTRPRKLYLRPFPAGKNSMRLFNSPVSRCFQSSGRPSGVAFPVQMPDVQASDGSTVASSNAASRLREKIFFMVEIGFAQMFICQIGNDATAGRARQETFFDQERFIDFF